MRPLLSVLLVAVLLGGCLGADKAAPPAATPEPIDLPVAQRPVTSAALSTYLGGLSEPLEGISFATAIVEQYRTPITELVELDTWVARPAIDAKVPIILDVTPYYGGGAPTGLGRVGTELIQRGYAVGVSSVRGTGQSGGCFTQGGPSEGPDTAAVIENLASQEWSNGNVGLMGVSYDGTTPQDVWVEAPPALKTIVPISGISDLYKYNFVNGVHIEPQGYAFNLYYWALVGASPAGLSGGAPSDAGHSATAAAGELCPEQAEVQEGGLTSGLDGNKDDYWAVRDFNAEARATWDRNPQRAAVWYVHGLQDWNVKPHNMQDWLTTIQESGVPYKVWLGQWGHAWPQPTGIDAKCEYDADEDRGASCRADWWTLGIVAWFDQFLKGVDTGILDAPRVQVQDDDGRWHHEQVWPPTDPARHLFRFTADGRLDQVGGEGTVSYHDGAGAPLYDVEQPAALDLAQTPFSVYWRSEPMAQEWLISGMPVFHANVTVDKPRANLILTIGEQLPDGTLRSFNFCAQSLNHVKDLAAGQPDITDARQEVTLQCFPQDDVLHQGSRLVVVAAGNTMGDGPQPGFQPLTYGALITIDMAGAWLELPVDHSIVYEDPQPYE
ncbi:MAG TPA: CocE/NonD family hydrolase [Candidatus Thermoplasmatota archaeon]|nr:CocE/NonD family hydrolase [Candidatus Thermoplasmatota archaeon]